MSQRWSPYAALKAPLRVLVSRTDGIGDVVLTLPLCGLLKTQLGARVIVLGRRYTRAVLEASPFVDEVLEWDAVEHGGIDAQAALLRSARADVVLHVYPRVGIARAALAARIPLRIGTSRRWYHWLTCNALERLGRRRSALHEAQLNARVARRLLGEALHSLPELVAYTRLEPQAEVPPDVAALIDRSRTTLVVHPLSNGSGSEWPLAHWRALIESLDHTRVQVLVTGSAKESVALRGWIATLPADVVDLTGRLALPELIALLARVDGLAAAGTGPLHLASAIGINALGLFTDRAPIHPGRWAPLGRRAGHLTPAAPCAGCRGRTGATSRCTCLSEIPVDAVRSRIDAWVDRGVLDPGPVLHPSPSLSPRSVG